MHYSYDANPYDAAYSQNAWGRLASVTFGEGVKWLYNVPGPKLRYDYVCQGLAPSQVNQQVTYGWDNEGRMTSIASAGASHTYEYDDMGRLSTMDNGDTARATYGAAGEMLTLWMNGAGTETRTYNSLLQMTRQRTVGDDYLHTVLLDMEYRYPTAQNNGRIAQSKDWVNGEEVTYTYDALQRLAKGETTGPEWGQAYAYDGFGNLTSKTVTKGTATTFSAGYDPATNRQTGISYDANGNVTVINGESVTWNVENRISGWEYDAWGKRVGTQVATGGFTLPGNYAVRTQTWDYTLYSVTGQRLAVVECTTAPQSEADYNYTDRWGSCGTKQLEPGYFGSRPLKVVDRLGSVRRRWSVQTGWSGSAQSFYPYGEYKESGGTEGVEAFGTYQRDSMAATGVDYAMQRYYSPGVGRFYSPDPSTDGVDYENPLTWNAYSYVNGDPINFNDPSGLGPVTLPPIVPGVNCSTAFINYAGQFGVTIQQLFDSDTGILGVMSYFEQKGSGTSGDQSVWAALDWTFLNRWDLSASDKAWFYGPSNIPTSLAASVTTGNSRSQVFTSSGQLQAGFTTQLMNILTGSPDSSQCDGLAVAFDTAMGTIRAHDHDPIPGLGYFPNPVPGALQFASNGALPSVGRYVTQTVVATMTDRGNLWTFYGATYNPPPPVRRPPRRPPMPPGRPRRPL